MRSRITAALAEAAKAPIDPARLHAIKSHLRYEFAGSLTTADAVADAVGTAVATTGRPESINELFSAFDRLTPTDLKRVAAKYFQPSNDDGHHPRDGDQEMTTSQSQARRAALILLAAAVTFTCQDHAAGRQARGVARRPSADALALAFQSAGRAAGRAPRRLAERSRRARRAWRH